MWVVIILIPDHCLSVTLEYGSSVWDTKSILLQDELDKVQKRATRFVTGNYACETGMDGWMDGDILRPFQQCFSHIRTMGCW